MDKGYLLSDSIAEKAVSSAINKQRQAESANEYSTKSEVIQAFVDYGTTQGYLDCMKELGSISWQDYEKLSRKQVKVRERLTELLEKRTLGTANT